MSGRLAAVLVLLGCALLAAPPARAEPCCGQITADGLRLEKFLDATGVEHLWIAGRHIDWRTGEPDPARPDRREAATHCSAFAAAIAKRLGSYLLRPPEHSQELLANAQMRWLRTDGAARGWQRLPGPLAAQAAANRGELVVEAFENPDPHRPGHIAITRPSEKSRDLLLRHGPQETQAANRNRLSTTTAEGFRVHPGAWQPGGGGGIAYYAHTVDWTRTD